MRDAAATTKKNARSCLLGLREGQRADGPIREATPWPEPRPASDSEPCLVHGLGLSQPFESCDSVEALVEAENPRHARVRHYCCVQGITG